MSLNKIRRHVLHETITEFEENGDTIKFQALENLKRWKDLTEIPVTDKTIINVIEGDWGAVTQEMTMAYGEMFAALNMANAYVFGGGYKGGSPAQEENMFRRTDCHFTCEDHQYSQKMTDLLSGKNGEVYLDVENPRVCFKGPENVNNVTDIGYKRLPDNEIFPFIELRAAAVDLSGKFHEVSSNPESEMRQRIRAQLDTLIAHDVKYVVLGAFGCGAFRNRAKIVARLYKEEIAKSNNFFNVISFAIFHAGYGPNNFIPFNYVFNGKFTEEDFT